MPKIKSIIPFHYNSDQKLIFGLSKRRLPSIRQLKQLRHFLTYKEKRVMAICLFVLVFSLVWLSGRFIWNRLVEVPKYGGEYTEGLIGSIQYINPILCQTNDADRDISRLIFSSLFKINPNGELENDLIKKYQISEDQKIYIFTLKNDILWHDGAKLTPSDIEFTLNAIQNIDFRSPLYRTFQGVLFEKISDKSFKLVLTEPFSPFLSTLTFGILPEHLWQNISPENSSLTELNKKPIGSGPFKYKSFKKDSSGYIKQYALIRFKDYYDRRPYLEKITFKLFSESEVALEALKNNQIDGMSFLSRKNFKEINNLENFKVYNFDMPQYSALFLNPKKQPLLKERKIRQALALSIDKKELARDIDSGAQGAYGPLDFIIKPKQDEYNLEQSAKLLKEAGWELEDKVLKKDGQQFELTITSVDNNEYIKILQHIKKQWIRLGIITNLEIVPRQKITTQVVEPREYQILLLAQILSYDPDPYPFWHSSQTTMGSNLSIFANKDIDDILESARKTTSFNGRIEKYKEFQKILKEECLAIFLFRQTYHYPLNKKIKGIDTQVIYLPADRFSNVDHWYIKTKKRLKSKDS